MYNCLTTLIYKLNKREIIMKNILIGLIASLIISTASYAGQFGVGFSGSFAAVSAEGTESEADGTADTSNRSASAGHHTIVPSAFAEYSLDNGFTIGYDYTIGSAEVSEKALTRTNVAVAATQGGAENDTATRTANAEIENVHAIYAELPLHAGLYIKGGYVQMDVNSLDSGSTGSYGNQSVDGLLYGLGYKNAFGTSGFYKIEGTMTDMDSFTISNSTTDKASVITANLDVVKATFAVGLNF